MTIADDTMNPAHKRLAQSLDRHDGYGAQPDESPVYILSALDGSFYELVPDERGGQLTLGDLRNVCGERND